MSATASVALVPAAGEGERLGLGPKAFLVLDGRTLLQRVVDTLATCVDHVVVGVPERHIAEARDQVGGVAEVIAGAGTRQDTVAKLFAAGSAPLVIIHDVTRPFASAELLRRVLVAAQEHGAAAAMTHPPIPVGAVRHGFITESHDRHAVMLPQSPQAYRRPVLAAALAHAAATGMQKQTTWQLLAAMGTPVAVVPGEEHNIKITTTLDWDIARTVIWPALRESK